VYTHTYIYIYHMILKVDLTGTMRKCQCLNPPIEPEIALVILSSSDFFSPAVRSPALSGWVKTEADAMVL
jgi:hypothetical protein